MIQDVNISKKMVSKKYSLRLSLLILNVFKKERKKAYHLFINLNSNSKDVLLQI